MLEWLNNLAPATVPAWLALAISVLLAAIKIWELIRDRVRVEIGGNFTSSESEGNEIYIRNVSPKAVILIYWEVFFGKAGLWRREERHIESAESSAGTTIAASSTCTLEFRHEHYFLTDAATLNGRAIWIRLYFAGRRPIVRKIYWLR